MPVPAPTSDDAVSVERISLPESRAGWQALAQRCGSIFSSWEWASAWWECFGEGRERELALLACLRGGALIGILPLCVQRSGPLRVARFLGAGPGDQLEPLCAPGDRAAVAAALRFALRERAVRCDVLLAERLPAGEWPPLLRARELRNEVNPVVVTGASNWEGYLASRSANFRGQLRTKERRLARGYSLVYRLTNAASLERDLDVLFALHASRWSEAGPGTFAGSWAGFHRAFAASALERGWLRLWTMELDGRPVATWYGFRYRGAECYYQSGRDPSLERESIGLVLLAHTMREAINDGVREYQLLRGGELYKSHFATEERGLSTIATAASRRGRVALAGAVGLLALPGPLGGRLAARMSVP